jgi:hypothetical protein
VTGDDHEGCREHEPEAGGPGVAVVHGVEDSVADRADDAGSDDVAKRLPVRDQRPDGVAQAEEHQRVAG